VPIRTVVLFNLGDAFGGFRMAVRPGLFGLNDPDAFLALESTIHDVQQSLSFHPPSRWPAIAASVARPQINGREASVDLIGDAADDRDGDVVMRAYLPFHLWPLGGWVVYEAWRRTSDGSWASFGEEKLAEMW
jgi:hypothetical protein